MVGMYGFYTVKFKVLER